MFPYGQAPVEWDEYGEVIFNLLSFPPPLY